MKEWIRAFLIGGLIMAGETVASQIIGPEYAALGIPAEFIAAFFITGRKNKIEYFLGMVIILFAFVIVLAFTGLLLYKNKYSGNFITSLSLGLDMILAFLAIKIYSEYK